MEDEDGLEYHHTMIAHASNVESAATHQQLNPTGLKTWQPQCHLWNGI